MPPASCMAWAILYTGPRGARHIHPRTVQPTRDESIAAFTDRKDLWRRLQRAGTYRCIRVNIQEAELR